jgi:hypothetical protein
LIISIEVDNLDKKEEEIVREIMNKKILYIKYFLRELIEGKFIVF